MSPVVRFTAAALRRRAGPLGRLAGWSAAEALPILLAGYLTARAVDDGFLAGRPGTGLGWLGVLAVAVAIGAVGTSRAYACLGDIVEPLRDELAERVVTGALHRSTAAGARPETAAVARLTHQVEIVRDTFAGLVMVVRGFLFTAGAALLGLFSLTPVVAGVVAVPLIAGLVLFAAALPAMVARQRDYVRADERLGEAAGTALAGHRDVVACGAQEIVADRVGRQVDRQAGAEHALARMAALRSLSLAVGGWLPLAVLLLAAPWLVRRGLTAGAVLGALVYVATGLQPALHALVQGVAGGGLRFAVTLDRILDATTPSTSPTTVGRVAAEPPRTGAAAAALPADAVAPLPSDAVGSGPGTGPPDTGTRPPGSGTRLAWAELRGVTFRYGPRARPVLDGFDLTVAEGAHLAVVGPSGTGKSTLAGLVAGLLRPQAGTVLLGGTPVDGAGPATLARHRVLIPQEAYVFTGTLLDNLRYLRPDARHSQVDAAVHRLGLLPLVRRLGGLAATVDPTVLSAGERQLVAAVRAYLSPAPLAILDEATCHLDPVAEATVEDAFGTRPGALVVVAHRISSALRARQVLILDGGPPLCGRHDELLTRSATYRELVGHWQGDPVAAGVATG
ncbi:ABC transporter ATP-binding protein [Plantactinospora sp. KLBMP9567]|uniref:ABC transporter ATP-binding protein n=1 Tax=Plantactinospora sp. KLBMP9567 TaxID=3085900 RepID=UPI0029814C5D|nr:ABC transporter ATP-binding protein [Plantactinospora sp. KLBMP9567]MDW5322612.1 ABC transporter ATP-binding protein [Plantactinospora sp. KLBMP9567]